MKYFQLVDLNLPIEILIENATILFYRVAYIKNMIEIICNDRLGKKVRVKCNSDDTIGDLKKLIAAQTGTKAEKIVLKKWCKYFFY